LPDEVLIFNLNVAREKSASSSQLRRNHGL
jgi:hypothetical protein